MGHWWETGRRLLQWSPRHEGDLNQDRTSSALNISWWPNPRMYLHSSPHSQQPSKLPSPWSSLPRGPLTGPAASMLVLYNLFPTRQPEWPFNKVSCIMSLLCLKPFNGFPLTALGTKSNLLTIAHLIWFFLLVWLHFQLHCGISSTPLTLGPSFCSLNLCSSFPFGAFWQLFFLPGSSYNRPLLPFKLQFSSYNFLKEIFSDNLLNWQELLGGFS